MTTSSTIAEVAFIKNLLILQDVDDLAYDVFDILYIDDVTGVSKIYTQKQFFDQHYHIYDVLRVIERIIKRTIPDLKFIPYKKEDVVQEGATQQNTITYHIDTLVPAKISQEGIGRRETGPRYRYALRFNNDNNRIYDIKGQLIDNYVQFRIYGKSRTEEQQLEVVFRHLLYVFAGSVQNVGVPVFRFIQGGTITGEGLNSVVQSTPIFMDYLIRTEDLYVTPVKTIRMIEMEVTQETGGI